MASFVIHERIRASAPHPSLARSRLQPGYQHRGAKERFLGEALRQELRKEHLL